jgi:hypothetical protein
MHGSCLDAMNPRRQNASDSSSYELQLDALTSCDSVKEVKNWREFSCIQQGIHSIAEARLSMALFFLFGSDRWIFVRYTCQACLDPIKEKEHVKL